MLTSVDSALGIGNDSAIVSLSQRALSSSRRARSAWSIARTLNRAISNDSSSSPAGTRAAHQRSHGANGVAPAVTTVMIDKAIRRRRRRTVARRAVRRMSRSAARRVNGVDTSMSGSATSTSVERRTTVIVPVRGSEGSVRSAGSTWSRVVNQGTR